MAGIFISYARGDDEPFVKQLYQDLKKHGIEVWWDRQAMESRGLTFLQEIRDAIEGSTRVIAVIGPHALTSEYVRAEWEHALLFSKGIIPILRQGEYPDWTQYFSKGAVSMLPEAGYFDSSSLSKSHAPDFRETRPYQEALDEVLRVLATPVVEPGRLLTLVPSLPPHFLLRFADIETIGKTVLLDIQQPTVVTSRKQTTALQGMGGVGKSVVAAAFARATHTRRAFDDGILWLTIGQEPHLLQNMRQVGLAFGDNADQYIDITSAKSRLVQVLENKNCLLVLDDIWDVPSAEPFVNAIGPRCRVLCTTRDRGLVTALGAQPCHIDVLNDADALRLLADWCELPVQQLPEQAALLIKECGNQPFALSLCGAMVRDGTPWNDLLDALRDADLSFLEKTFPNYPYSDVMKSLKVSVDVLSRTDRSAATRYHELAVFPENAVVPEAAIVTLWQHTGAMKDRDARKFLTTLECTSLIRVAGQSPGRHITMHHLQHDYLQAAQEDPIGLNQALLEAYFEKSGRHWESGANDGYFFQRLDYHLLKAGRKEELRSLLADFGWINAKLQATNIADLINDYDALVGDAHLSLPCEAIRLSAHVLGRDKTQLAGQLLGRLPSDGAQAIQDLRAQAAHWRGSTWLRPLNAMLTPPGGPLVRTLVGHTQSVSAVAMTPDGRYAISASDDHTLKVWEVDVGAEVRTLTGHANWVRGVAVTVDGRCAISGSYDDTLKVWDVFTGAEVRILSGHADSVSAVAVTPDGRYAISASYDETLKVWSLDSGTQVRTLAGHTDAVNAIAVTPDGRYAISASSDQTLKVWEIGTGIAVQTLIGHTQSVSAVTITPDGRYAISASDDQTLKVWDAGTGMAVQTLIGHARAVNAVAVTPDGRQAVSASSDHILGVWDVVTGTRLRTLSGHTGSVNAVTVTPNGRYVISASTDHSLKVWSLETVQAGTRTSAGHTGSVSAVTVTPNNRHAISASYDHTLKVWDVGTGNEERTLTGHTHSVNAIAVTPNSRYAVSGSYDHTLKLWDIDTGTAVRTLSGHTGSVSAVTVTPNGRYAISASADQTLKVWDLETAAEARTLTGHTGGISAVTVTPNGRYAISTSADRTVKVWDLDTGTEVRTFTGHTNWVRALTTTPDGRYAISASYDNVLKVWDLDTGAEVRTLAGHTNWVRAVTVTPDSRYAISASYDHTLKVWDVETGMEVRDLVGHTDSVSGLTITPDGRYTISASDDDSLRVWELATGKLIATFNGDGGMTACSVGQDGHTIVAGEASGRVHILRLEGV